MPEKLFLMTGKGGVGKTTLAAARALAYADAGKNVLIALCNAKERLSALFGSPPLGHDVMPLAKNVWGVNMEPERALEEYGTLVLKSRSAYKLLFDNRMVRAFLRAVPGLHEWSMLGKAWWHTTERLGSRPKYDVVLLDAPATGHGLDMLRVPKVILDVVPSGMLRRDAERAMTLFRDPSRFSVDVVTRAEELPVTETLELLHALSGELSLPVGRVMVNAVVPPLFSEEERAWLLAHPTTQTSAAEETLHLAKLRAGHEKVSGDALSRLRAGLSSPPLVFPLVLPDASSPDAVRTLSFVFRQAGALP